MTLVNIHILLSVIYSDSTDKYSKVEIRYAWGPHWQTVYIPRRCYRSILCSNVFRQILYAIISWCEIIQKYFVNQNTFLFWFSSKRQGTSTLRLIYKWHSSSLLISKWTRNWWTSNSISFYFEVLRNRNLNRKVATQLHDKSDWFQFFQRQRSCLSSNITLPSACDVCVPQPIPYSRACSVHSQF